ncbi:hypothetical protein ACFL02_07150 [Planctomycetota bacterium]
MKRARKPLSNKEKFILELFFSPQFHLKNRCNLRQGARGKAKRLEAGGEENKPDEMGQSREFVWIATLSVVHKKK